MKKLTPLLENRAIELYANTPNIKHGDVAEKLDISDKTLMKMRKNGDFWDKDTRLILLNMKARCPMY